MKKKNHRILNHLGTFIKRGNIASPISVAKGYISHSYKREKQI